MGASVFTENTLARSARPGSTFSWPAAGARAGAGGAAAPAPTPAPAPKPTANDEEIVKQLGKPNEIEDILRRDFSLSNRTDLPKTAEALANLRVKSENLKTFDKNYREAQKKYKAKDKQNDATNEETDHLAKNISEQEKNSYDAANAKTLVANLEEYVNKKKQIEKDFQTLTLYPTDKDKETRKEIITYIQKKDLSVYKKISGEDAISNLNTEDRKRVKTLLYQRIKDDSSWSFNKIKNFFWSK
jgi:hypothetical protein